MTTPYTLPAWQAAAAQDDFERRILACLTARKENE